MEPESSPSKTSQTSSRASSRTRLTTEEVVEGAIGTLGRWHYQMIAWIFLMRLPVAFQQLAIVFLDPHNHEFYCIDNEDKCARNCTKHVFDNSTYVNTIKSEWDLVCSREILADLGQSVSVSGVFVGNIVFGIISDKFGRRIGILIAIACQAITGIIASFAPSLIAFVALRFLLATATGGTVCTCFVLLIEIIGARKRILIGVLFHIPQSIGFLVLPFIAYFVRNWRHFQLFISLPSLIFLTFYSLVTESPRWLLIVGKTERAVELMEKIAVRNKMDPSNIRFNVEMYSRTHQEASGSIRDLFSTTMLKNTLGCSLVWLSTGLGFYGTAMYLDVLGGSIYIDTAISASLEFPGIILIYLWIISSGRKLPMVFTSALAGLSLLATVFILHGDIAWIRLVWSIFALVNFSMCSICTLIYTSELYPTVIRDVAMGFCTMWITVGAMFTPFEASDYVDMWVAPVILGTLPVIVAIFIFFCLPDTRAWKLTDNVSEAEMFHGFG